MAAAARSVVLLSMLVAVAVVSAIRSCAAAAVLSSRLIHRFSDEMRARRVPRRGEAPWPERGTPEYYRRLLSGDLLRQRMMKLRSKPGLLFPAEGSSTLPLGNDFGWLHYTWISIGVPHVSFLVALDSGSDLLWVPCNCIQCAPLSASHYSTLDRDLNEYSISGSNTSKQLPCSHQLCELGSKCQNTRQPCPYTVKYYLDDVSSSGFLVEDILHLASGGDDTSNNSVQASVILGCGRKQSGYYLDGVAPDGLMGLGLGKISVPSFLARAGLVQNSFSLCFNEDSSGRIFFGDQGLAGQHSTAFLPLDGNYSTYIVGVDACCIGRICQELSSFKALFDSGASFTYFPGQVYEKVVKEFDRQVNAIRSRYEGVPWEYCYESSFQDFLKIPRVKLIFPLNNSFVVFNPVFKIYEKQDIIGFCLAIQPTDDDIGAIGQNFMTGYRVVFDRENLKLGWSRSNCTDLTSSRRMPVNASPAGMATNPFPPNEQQSTQGERAVGPALAGRTPSKPSAATTRLLLPRFCLLVRSLLLYFLLLTAL